MSNINNNENLEEIEEQRSLELKDKSTTKKDKKSFIKNIIILQVIILIVNSNSKICIK